MEGAWLAHKQPGFDPQHHILSMRTARSDQSVEPGESLEYCLVWPQQNKTKATGSELLSLTPLPLTVVQLLPGLLLHTTHSNLKWDKDRIQLLCFLYVSARFFYTILNYRTVKFYKQKQQPNSSKLIIISFLLINFHIYLLTIVFEKVFDLLHVLSDFYLKFHPNISLHDFLSFFFFLAPFTPFQKTI